MNTDFIEARVAAYTFVKLLRKLDPEGKSVLTPEEHHAFAWYRAQRALDKVEAIKEHTEKIIQAAQKVQQVATSHYKSSLDEAVKALNKLHQEMPN